MIRSIGAVVGGLLVTVVLVIVLTLLATVALGIPNGGPPTPLYLVLNLLGGAIAGACGGATAVRLAPRWPHGHVGTLAVVILLLSLPTLFSPPPPGQPSWYGLTLSVLGPTSVLLGGLLAIRHVRSPPIS